MNQSNDAELAATLLKPPTPLRVGILGGMGPMATAEAFRRIILATPATCDQEHLAVAIDSDPSIPDRSRALLGTGPDPRPAMLASAKKLVDLGSELICNPCNTAHAYHQWLSDRIGVPIIHMVMETMAAVRKIERSPLGLLATEGTISSKIYEQAADAFGLEIVVPNRKAQGQISQVIRCLKAGNDLLPLVHQCEQVIRSLISDGAQCVALGCTELSLLASHMNSPVPLVDALQEMAQATVDVAFGRRAFQSPREPLKQEA